jgi:hypothetical protein
MRGTVRSLRALARRPRVLAICRPRSRPYQGFRLWLQEHDPALGAQFDLRWAGEPIWNLDPYRLVFNWFQDPIRDIDPRAYAWMQRLEKRADRLGIPVVNRSEMQSRSRKSVQSRILRAAAFDTPPVGPPDAFDFPLVLRSDVDHTGRVHRFEDAAALERFDRSSLREPVASPFVETRGPDGWYRKYRYLLVGERGIPRHLQISRHWLVRMDHRDLRREHVEEERAYTSGVERHHDLFDGARRALGLDFVAFDFSYRLDGGVLIWEANPMPTLWVREFYDPEFRYQLPHLDRIYRLWREDLRERLA